MSSVVSLIVGLVLTMSVAGMKEGDSPSIPQADTIKNAEVESKEAQKSDQIIVYYLHMNRRCVTCEKLEAYSREAIVSGFAQQLKDSTVVWRVENFEKEGNEHFAEDYKLYSQSLIISRSIDGKEKEWKNLDKIWQLVGNKEKFITYVQSEIEKYLKSETKE